MKKINVGLFNDSFPPVIDGVANTVLNYAKTINKYFGKAVVATPSYPRIKDNYDFKVVRYPSVNISNSIGYRLGNPYSIKAVTLLERAKLDIIHVHSPFTAALLARAIRMYTKAPIVFTYHTKYNIDVEKRVGLTQIQNFTMKFILNNIEAADEVWAVSQGAADNLREIGFSGNIRIMQNGTDFERYKSSELEIRQVKEEYGITTNPGGSEKEFIFSFVGRMMWYKNIRLTIDSLSSAKEQGLRFKMIFIGDGSDRAEIEEYCKEKGIYENSIFTGSIKNREKLRVFFSMTDLFLFPSTYDTNGLVVREAAACSCPSLIISGSCAAEGIDDNISGILVEEDASEYAQRLLEISKNPQILKQIGETASRTIYIHWHEAVEKAYERYLEILDERKNN